MRGLKMKAATRCHCVPRSGSEPKILSFWLCYAAYGALLPQQGIEPGPSAKEAQSPNYWTTRSDNSLRQRNIDKT